MPTDFYYLAICGTVHPGEHVASYDRDGNPELITDDPRHLRPSEGLDDYSLADVILGTPGSEFLQTEATPACEIARLSPCSPAAPTSSDASHDAHGYDYVCQAGWEVVAIDPIDGLLGPNAAHIIAAMQTAERVLAREQDGPQAEAYQVAADARTEFALDDPDLDAAADALARYGADGYWWAHGGSCAYGPEFTALAARDLIGAAPGWTRDAYDRLTAPWIAAFGEPIHPNDRPDFP